VSGVSAALKQVQINSESDLDDYSVEIDIMMQCKHRNVVELYEAYFFNKKLLVCYRVGCSTYYREFSLHTSLSFSLSRCNAGSTYASYYTMINSLSANHAYLQMLYTKEASKQKFCCLIIDKVSFCCL